MIKTIKIAKYSVVPNKLRTFAPREPAKPLHYASIAAISKVSGINQHQLSHYANGIKNPRTAQRRRIVEGLHRIGRELIAVE